jgi:hypothetical protein
VNFLHSFYIFSAVPFFLLLLLSPLFRKKYRIWKFIFVFFPHTMTVAEQMKNTSGSASQQLLTSTKIKEGMNMANRSSNTAAVPEAKGALDKFKFEVASELGVPLSDGYNGNLTSKQNGSVGGYMVKKMIEQQERQMSGGSSGQY